nr:immunoglobulin heavy chain junction region [Mus musculus]
CARHGYNNYGWSFDVW